MHITARIHTRVILPSTFMLTNTSRGCTDTVCAQSGPIFPTPWTVAHQAPLSMEFSRQEYWSGLPFLTVGDLPDSGIEPVFPASPALVSRLFTTEPPGASNIEALYPCLDVQTIQTLETLKSTGLNQVEWMILNSSCLPWHLTSGMTNLEKAMAPHSSTLAWKIPWTEEPGRLQSMWSLRVGHN